MSGGHTHDVDPGAPLDGPLERLAPEAKVVGAVALLGAAVATPAQAYWVWAVHGIIAVGLTAVALVPARVLARRFAFEAPFVALAVALVIAGTGPRVPVAGLSVSGPGLEAAVTILSRATFGVVIASVLAATTTPAHLLVALARLRLPPLLRLLAELAVRYLAVLRDELERLRLAQALRSPGSRRLRPEEVAGVAAALFVRAYERGERVHLARTARGGTSLAVDPATWSRAPKATVGTWLVALTPALAAGATVLAAFRVG